MDSLMNYFYMWVNIVRSRALNTSMFFFLRSRRLQNPEHCCYAHTMGVKLFFNSHFDIQKSVNLQYNKLVCWADGTNNSSTKHYRFQEFFFHKSLHNSLEKPFFFYKITKMKIKSFECPKSVRNYEKKYLERQTLGLRSICPIGPANQLIIF